MQAVDTMPRGHEETLRIFADACDLPPDLQREAIERTLRSAAGELRQRALRAGATLLGDDVLVGYLREEADDVLRNAGLEMLKLRGRRSFATAIRLLRDADRDVVLQAVLVLEAIRDPRAWPHLRPLLRSPDPNVVQAAIIAAGRLGGAGASRDLIPFLSADPWLQVAAAQALGDLRATSAVPHLRSLLTDAFMEPFAAETLARIGDASAFRALTSRWLLAEQELDPRFYLELIATMLMQFEHPPRDERVFEAAERYLDSSDPATAAAAAWCVVVLGPAPAARAALELIVPTITDARCPLPVAARSELLTDLIEREPPLRDWGYEILQRFPTALPPRTVAGILRKFPPTSVDAVGMYLARMGDRELSAAVLELWLERIDERDRLTAAVRRHARGVCELLSNARLTGADRCALLEALGGDAASVSREIERLKEPERWEAIAALRSRAVLKRLPWDDWLSASNTDDGARALADATSRSGCREMLPLIRERLSIRPVRELIQAVGDLADRESVPVLSALLGDSLPLLRAVVFDSLGRIGGPDARAVLRRYCVGDSADVGQACRALAMCATSADQPLLRVAAQSLDLSVRLAVVAPLASFNDEESCRVLCRLLFDRSTAVAKKAQIALEHGWGGA